MSGLVAVLNNEQLDQRLAEQAAASKVVEDTNPNDALLSGLCGHLERCWEHAKQAKTEIERQMVDSLERRAGKYSVEKEAQIRSDGAPLIYMNLVANKCRAAEGWLLDIAMPAGERPFSIEPSPVPDISPDIKNSIQEMLIMQMQQMVMSGAVVDISQMPALQEDMERKLVEGIRAEATKRADKMEDQIDDVASEGDWYAAIEDCIPHLTTHHACFLKGPIITKKKRIAYQPVDDLGTAFTPTLVEKLVPTFYAVDPMNIYPSANSRGVQDGYLFEKVPMRRGAIRNCVGMPGFDEGRINAALVEYHDGLNVQVSTDSSLQRIDRTSGIEDSPDAMIDVLEFRGAVSGKMLADWGMPGVISEAEYEIEAWKVGRFVIRVMLNPHPTGRRPYESASFDRRPGAFWGWGGIPHTIRDIADICNACARAIVFNMAMASGPQVTVNVERLAEGETITDIRPWKIWQTKEPRNPQNSQKAVEFFVPDVVANVLQGVYEYFSSKADEYTGIPAYATGTPDSTGAAGTASGMSMLMGQATRQMKRVVASIDRMIEGSVSELYLHEMLHNPDPSIKGDSWVRSRGAGSLMVREQNQIRLNEALNMTANPIDMAIIGNEGRAEMLRALIKDFDIPVENVVPGRDELIRRAKEAMVAEAAAMAGPDPSAPQATQPDGSAMGGQQGNTVQ